MRRYLQAEDQSTYHELISVLLKERADDASCQTAREELTHLSDGFDALADRWCTEADIAKAVGQDAARKDVKNDMANDTSSATSAVVVAQTAGDAASTAMQSSSTAARLPVLVDADRLTARDILRLVPLTSTERTSHFLQMLDHQDAMNLAAARAADSNNAVHREGLELGGVFGRAGRHDLFGLVGQYGETCSAFKEASMALDADTIDQMVEVAGSKTQLAATARDAMLTARGGLLVALRSVGATDSEAAASAYRDVCFNGKEAEVSYSTLMDAYERWTEALPQDEQDMLTELDNCLDAVCKLLPRRVKAVLEAEAQPSLSPCYTADRHRLVEPCDSTCDISTMMQR